MSELVDHLKHMGIITHDTVAKAFLTTDRKKLY